MLSLYIFIIIHIYIYIHTYTTHFSICIAPSHVSPSPRAEVPGTALLADVARVPSLYPAGFRFHEENPRLGEPESLLKIRGMDASPSSTWANKYDFMI